MTISADPVLNQAVVDVQYGRGIVYLDKCGSLLLRLEDTLGKPFEGSVPTMDHAELRSAAERLVVTYGPRSFNVTQAWVRSPARVEQIAPLAWGHVADTLGVSRAVSRCGVRFMFLWKVDSHAEGQELLTNCRFLVASDEWKAVVGDGAAYKAWQTVVEDQRGKLRIAVDVLETKVQGGSLSAELVELVPKYAILLDLDHTYPATEPFALSKEALKDFIRSAWQRSKTAATTMGKQLGVDNGARKRSSDEGH